MTLQQQLPNRRRRAGEVAGNATAECAAVCCCVPCAVMDMVALAAYKVPAGLWKKAMHNKRKKRLQNQLMKNKMKNELALLDHNKKNNNVTETVIVGPTLEEHLAKEESAAEDGVKLEEEMWARFSVTGFWRSGSQHEPELQTGEKDR